MLENPVNIGQELKFNTGRLYTAEGQQIKATVLDITEDGQYSVHFEDTSRMISGVVEVGLFPQSAIMSEYDAGRYTGS